MLLLTIIWYFRISLALLLLESTCPNLFQDTAWLPSPVLASLYSIWKHGYAPIIPSSTWLPICVSAVRFRAVLIVHILIFVTLVIQLQDSFLTRLPSPANSVLRVPFPTASIVPAWLRAWFATLPTTTSCKLSTGRAYASCAQYPSVLHAKV